jgi:hypothetical protein
MHQHIRTRLRCVQAPQVWYKSCLLHPSHTAKAALWSQQCWHKPHFSWNPTSKSLGLSNHGGHDTGASGPWLIQRPGKFLHNHSHTSRLKCAGEPSCKNHIHCCVRNKTSSNNWGKYLQRSHILGTSIFCWSTHLTAPCIMLTEPALWHNVLLKLYLLQLFTEGILELFSLDPFDSYWCYEAPLSRNTQYNVLIRTKIIMI